MACGHAHAQHLDECIPDSDQIIRNIKQLARTSNGRARLFIVMVRTGSLALALSVGPFLFALWRVFKHHQFPHHNQGLNEGNLSELVNGLVWNDALCREHLTEQVCPVSRY
jgi:hypothetical protein